MTILFSRDPVAIDAAAVDVFTEHGLLSDDEQELAALLLAQAEAAGIGRRRHFVERVAF